MSNLVIVAIPAADEPVWKVSSEKVPHMTLLFLGPLEADDNVQRMADFIEHAVEVSEHGPFYATVDYRDELGPDKADVLYFKDDRSLKWVNSFRNQLLQQNDIRAEFEEMEAAGQQYPEWIPHLTLGYPDAPAKPLPNDYPIYSVCFDRIALWTTDFDGPEFRLEWPERDESSYPSLAYSDVGEKAVSDLLSHHGVKGMKWGRRTSAERSANRSAKKVAKKDKKFEQDAASVKTWVELHNAGADHVNQHLPKINEEFTKKHPKEMQDGTLFNENHPVSKAYAKAINDKFVEGLNKAADAHGTNASGTRKIKIVSENHNSITEFGWSHGTAKVQHAAVDSEDPTNKPLLYKATRDEHGMFLGVETLDESQEELEEGDMDELEQTALGKKFVLEHASVLDNPTLAQQIKDKIKDIFDDVDGDADGDVALFGDPLIRAKLQSVLDDFYKDPNVDNVAVYSAMGEAFMHYGIKGMRWGRTTRGERGSSPEPVAPSATSRVPHGDKRKTKIETHGGENHPAHEDAIKVAEAQTKLKKSGLSALSNKELRDVATRVQLEQQVSLLTGHKGKQFVKRQLIGAGNQTVQRGLAKGIATGAAKKGGKAALLFA